MQIPEHARILELGCGNGILWQKNSKDIKEKWDITLSDFSEGMLKSAQQNICRNGIKYEIIDIQNIPYVDESFDIIIARHMLYHVPDLYKALAEVKRVLKKNGKFYASTNGGSHMQELAKLVKGYDNKIDFESAKYTEKFGMENGGKLLEKYFDKVQAEDFRGQIVVHEAEPIVTYILSSFNARSCFSDEQDISRFQQYVQSKIDKTGSFCITTCPGMFTASA